ncbi:MAG: metallophosphoesterase family protein [Candidatus Hodarchaeota archaeon]
MPDKVEIARYELKKKDIGIETKCRLVLISDSHVTPYGSIFNEKVFLEGIRQINEIDDISYIIHLGDVTDNGTVDEYVYFNKLIQNLSPELRDKLHFIPGNHDSKNVGDLLFEEYIAKDRSFTLELPNDSVIFGLDSTEPDENIGEIGFKTTQLFKNLIEQYSGLKIVCFHHQLVPIPRTGRERSAIVDAGNVLKMLLDTNVNLVLNGHRHITNLYNMTDGDGELLIFNAGTMSCNKTRHHELWTYTVIDLDSDMIAVDIRSIRDENTKKFITRPFFAGVSHDVTLENNDVVARIVHMANSAFSTKHSHDEKAWKKAAEKINSTECDLIIHSGDLLDQSFKEDFELARDYLKDLDHPLIVIPGHMETRHPRGWDYFQEIIGDLDPYFENEKLLFVGINSCKTQVKKGVIGRRVLNEIVNATQKALTKKIVGLTLYHDIIPTPLERWEATLTDSGDVLSVFALSGVDLILSGSSYSNWSVQVENAIFSSCSSICNKKALLHRKKGNSFNIVSVFKEGSTLVQEYQIQEGAISTKRIFKIPVFM